MDADIAAYFDEIEKIAVGPAGAEARTEWLGRLSSSAAGKYENLNIGGPRLNKILFPAGGVQGFSADSALMGQKMRAVQRAGRQARLFGKLQRTSAGDLLRAVRR